MIMHWVTESSCPNLAPVLYCLHVSRNACLKIVKAGPKSAYSSRAEKMRQIRSQQQLSRKSEMEHAVVHRKDDFNHFRSMSSGFQQGISRDLKGAVSLAGDVLSGKLWTRCTGAFLCDMLQHTRKYKELHRYRWYRYREEDIDIDIDIDDIDIVREIRRRSSFLIRKRRHQVWCLLDDHLADRQGEVSGIHRPQSHSRTLTGCQMSCHARGSLELAWLGELLCSSTAVVAEHADLIFDLEDLRSWK